MTQVSDEYIQKLYNEFQSIRKATNYLRGKGVKINRETYRQRLNSSQEALKRENKEDDKEVKKYIDKLAHQKQHQQDINRIERKTWRNSARFSNAFEEVDRELIRLLSTYKIDFKNPVYKDKQEYVGIIQLSDLHINCVVDTVFNKYNIEVASKRLRKHIELCKKSFQAYNVKKVVVCMTGDLMNADRVLDKIMTNHTNKANALYITTVLMTQVFNDLCSSGYSVSTTFVTANETRTFENIPHEHILASDNYDAMLFNCLKLLCKDSGITFIHPTNVTESVVKINGRNILLLHGHLGVTKDLNSSIQKLITKYASANIIVDYALFGHIHQAMISDFFARSGSLVGGDSYASFGVNVASKASQNCFIVGEEIIGIRNELDKTDNIVGYTCPTDLYLEHKNESVITIE